MFRQTTGLTDLQIANINNIGLVRVDDLNDRYRQLKEWIFMNRKDTKKLTKEQVVQLYQDTHYDPFPVACDFDNDPNPVKGINNDLRDESESNSVVNEDEGLTNLNDWKLAAGNVENLDLPCFKPRLIMFLTSTYHVSNLDLSCF